MFCKKRRIAIVLGIVLVDAIAISIALYHSNNKLGNYFPTNDIGSCFIQIDEDVNTVFSTYLYSTDKDFSDFLESLGDVQLKFHFLYRNNYEIEGTVYRISLFDSTGNLQKHFVINRSMIYFNHKAFNIQSKDIELLLTYLQSLSINSSCSCS